MGIYEAVAYAMRYWFVLVIAAILLCVIVVSIVEYRDKKRIMANAQKYIGYLDVMYSTGNDTEPGERITLAAQNIIGSAASCNIIINEPGVTKRHVRIFARDNGIFLDVYVPNNTQLNGRQVKHEERIKTGDVILVGETALQVHLKEGAAQ